VGYLEARRPWFDARGSTGDVDHDGSGLYTGESSYTVHLIETVEVDDMDGPLLVTINYAQDGGLNTFSFYYEPADGGVITFKNQRDMKWKRQA
jgi:hypothetical protein